MQKTAQYFKVDYRTILRDLDTKLATIKDGKLVLFFSNKLTEEENKYIIK